MTHEHHGYGLFPGGDPRRFKPDGEDSNSPAEIAKHRAACAEWNARERKGDDLPEPVAGAVHGQLVNPSTGEVKGSFIACGVSGFGMGVYAYDCDDPECLEAQAPLDPDDAYGAFERWKWDAEVTGAFGKLHFDSADELADVLREAFAAGFKAREAAGDD